MDFIYHLGLVLLLVAIVFTPMFGVYYLFKLFWNTFIEPRSKNYYGNIDIKFVEFILLNKFQYYQKLNELEKTRFIKRLDNFISNKEFIPSGGMELTEEMIVLISASAIQLTFGLEEYLLLNFSKIFIYPKEYYSKSDNLYHKGEANLAGAIVFSWNNFMDGYNKPHDNYNLGLHEMAHALRFDKFKSSDYDEFFANYFEKWNMIAKEEFIRLKNHQPSFFREYGGTNINEFFSVCVEYFFESPKEFKEIHPEIYKHMCILLNQNPLTNEIIENQSKSFSFLNKTEFQLQEPIFYKSENTAKNILALLFAIGFWLMIVVNALKEEDNGMYIFSSIVMLIIGYFVTSSGFKKIYFYSNGIKIKYLLPNIFEPNKIFSYDEVICVEFHEHVNNDNTDELQISYLDNGKIKYKRFQDDFVFNQVLHMADLIVEKKVAVKLNSFAQYKKN